MKLDLKPNTSYLLAISGGGDSMALAHLAQQQSLSVAWAHFNHGWNASEIEAAEFVAHQAQKLGVVLHTMQSTTCKPSSNAEAHARAARYAYFAELCTKHEYAGVVIAHTQTDVAETFLMRAGKGSGVRGLAAMQPHTQRHGLNIYRPLLGYSRAALREYLIAQRQPWLEDPENVNQTNQRAKIRALLPALEAAGVTVTGLAAAAHALARADAALMPPPLSFSADAGVPLPALLAAPEEYALRHLESVLRHHHPNQLPPRTGKRLALLSRLRTQSSGQATLGGLIWRWQNGRLHVCPEPLKPIIRH